MNLVDVELSPEQRERLAHKGRLLYGKFCGTDGHGICAESFALYHIWRGESIVARDLLAYLEHCIEDLHGGDPDGRLAMTEALAGRIREYLSNEGDEPPDPSQWGAILKARKTGQ